MPVDTLRISHNAEGISISFAGAQFLGQSDASALYEELDGILQRDKPKAIWFDLTGVGMISSDFLAVFITQHRKGVKVVLINPSKDVRSVVEITKLDTMFEMIGDE